jgi:hypothetical protein
MLSRIIALPDKEVVAYAAPTLVISLVIAEVFFKFGSFILEAVAMLAVWWALASIARLILGSRKGPA